ncbi:MAG: DUF6588 family protein [Bacteroidota bacterium]
MKTLKLTILSVALLVSGSTFAQFEDYLLGGIDDANTLFNHYMSPMMKGIGYGFNNGWYNTAKPHETLGFDLTISFNAALVPVKDQSFVFDPNEYTATTIASGNSTLPTAMGGAASTVLQYNIDQQDIDPSLPPGIISATYNAPSGYGEQLKEYTLGQLGVPSPVIQAGIGLVKGTELKIRWMPEVNRETVYFKYFGVGALHSIDQWIPGLKSLPFLDISGFIGYTKIYVEYPLPVGDIGGENQMASFDINTTTFQVIGSAHIAVVTGYLGIGYDNFKTNFKMLGTYDLYPGIVPAVSDPINLEQKGEGSPRVTAGVRLKLAIVTLHADYTLREYNTLTLGLGFSFR